MQELMNRAKELLENGTVARVLGWKAGDLPYNPEPAYFDKAEDLKSTTQYIMDVKKLQEENRNGNDMIKKNPQHDRVLGISCNNFTLPYPLLF